MTLTQLRTLGLSDSAVRSRVTAGKLHRVHRGVYAVGHPVMTAEACWTAAVLACGPGAALSHRSAAAVWNLRPTSRRAIDVIAPRLRGRSRPGIHAHGAGTLDPADVTKTRGIPCTSVARTLLDLAEVVDRHALERACNQAEMLRLFDRRALEDVLGRADGRRGAPVLRAVVADRHIGETLTRGELEERFLQLCSSAGIPKPQVNSWITLDGGAVQADFLWRAERLIVETDGYRTHGTRHGFEGDRRRDQRLMAAGWRVMRCTWRQVIRGPDEVAAAITALLAGPIERASGLGETVFEP